MKLDAKICSCCKEEKSFLEFSNSKRTKDGFRFQCKVCASQSYAKNKELFQERNRQNYLKNKEAYKQRAREWKEANREKARASSAKSRKNAPREQTKNNELKTKYGISWDEYVQMFDTQAGGCAICRKPLQLVSTVRGVTAHVDHCHTTGKVRGLLCNSCNRGIGYLQDNASLLRLAAEYLDAS